MLRFVCHLGIGLHRDDVVRTGVQFLSPPASRGSTGTKGASMMWRQVPKGQLEWKGQE